MNLAHDPGYRAVLEPLRSALQQWRREFGDMGDIPEQQMVRQMWPDGRQPVTAIPLFIPLGSYPDHVGVAPAEDGAKYESPLRVMMYCATQGASIAYTLEEGEDAYWLLYTGPLRLAEGMTSVRAKAIRIGYQESAERVMRFTVRRRE